MTAERRPLRRLVALFFEPIPPWRRNLLALLIVLLFLAFFYGAPAAFERAGFDVEYRYCGETKIICGWRIRLFTYKP